MIISQADKYKHWKLAGNDLRWAKVRSFPRRSSQAPLFAHLANQVSCRCSLEDRNADQLLQRRQGGLYDLALLRQTYQITPNSLDQDLSPARMQLQVGKVHDVASIWIGVEDSAGLAQESCDGFGDQLRCCSERRQIENAHLLQ